ncbi:MAG: ribosome small subunit-dependent GTPase A [Erysipelotrichia bacterium]|nr:ribosome small subunit-dependent GTPase A [Erysipelotrichia bacterium]
MKARIVKIVSKDYVLQRDDGTRFPAIVMGKVRQQTIPVTGDIVEAECSNGKWGIQKILPRANQLKRPAIANVDQAIIVMSVKEPEFSSILIDRLSFLIVHAGITPLLCVTKTDLGISDETEHRIREYESGPMRTVRTAKDVLDPSLAEILSGRITVLTGQSGAGKSSLLNKLDPTFRLATQEISKALGRGRHTTRHNELHVVAGGLVADTPGFSSLDFSDMDVTELAQSVLEFQPYLGKCRFNDCVHQNEPGCMIKQAVEEGLIPKVRYDDYLNVLKLIQERKEKYL